jgi:hypothetical protein
MIRSIDPRSGQSFGPTYPEAEAADVASAVGAAVRAQAMLDECFPSRCAAPVKSSSSKYLCNEIICFSERRTAVTRNPRVGRRRRGGCVTPRST